MERYKLTKDEYKTIYQIFAMKEKSLLKGLVRILGNYYGSEKVFATSHYIYATGDIPVTLIAHLDTVHTNAMRDMYHDEQMGVLWSPQGLGADDRAGVFSIIKILEDGYRPSIIFCTQEEMGGIGARMFLKDFPKPAVATNILIELDRQGSEDAVYYDCENEEMEDYISAFGFVTDWGSFSDISVIAPKWKVGAVNLSIGYLNEHTRWETLHYREMFNTIKKVENILKNQKESPVFFKYIPSPYCYGRYWNDATTRAIASNIMKTKVMCLGCEDMCEPQNITTVEEEGYIFNFCPDCSEKFVEYCEYCGKPFLNFTEEPLHYCADCVTKHKATEGDCGC